MKSSIAILGLGKSGNSAINYFEKNADRFGISKIYVWDDNKVVIDKQSVISFSKPEEWDWKDLQSVIFSPGIPIELPKPHIAATLAKQNNVPIICDIELLWRDKNPKSKIIAITGTNGKSTTTALIYHILKENNISTQIGGNFGIPVLDLDLEKESWFVIETSSFQLDLLKNTKFDISVFLNLTPDHMERYITTDNYAKSKKRVFKYQNEQDIGIICNDTEIMQKIAHQTKAEYKSKFINFKTGEYLSGNKFPNLPGFHNLQNITAAYLVCKQIGLSDEQIITSIKTFKGLDHRIQNVFETPEVKFVNDSKATNADATEPALKTFSNIYWLAGGVPKEGGIESLKPYFHKIKHAYFYGQAREEFAKTYKNTGLTNYSILNTLKEAFNKAATDAFEAKNQEQNIVLLSPACASFDEFKNYEERGKTFADMAKNCNFAKIQQVI